VRGLNIPNRITPAEAEGFVGNSRALAEEEAFREFLEREVSDRASHLGEKARERKGTVGQQSVPLDIPPPFIFFSFQREFIFALWMVGLVDLSVARRSSCLRQRNVSG